MEIKNKEELINYCKTVTRKDFCRKEANSSCYDIEFSSEFRKEIPQPCRKYFWEAIEEYCNDNNIKFKDDLESERENNMENKKELNAIEVFRILKKGDKYINISSCPMVKSISMDDIGIKFNDGKIEKVNGINLNDKFVKEQKSVTYSEAYDSKKKVRVEHELIKETNYDKLGKHYNTIDNVLYLITMTYEEKETRDILDNGKWFIEED